MASWERQIDEPVENFFNGIHELAQWQGSTPIALPQKYIQWQDFRTADRLIPPPTLYQFLDFAFEGHLPGGGRSAYPLLTEDEIPLLVQAAMTWAPAPHNTALLSITDQIVMRSAAESNVMPVPYTILDMKSRLWEGMVPMTRSRWYEKQLHKPEQWNDAMQYFFQIVWTFFYINKISVQAVMREQFNIIAQDLAGFQAALNAKRRAGNSSATLINMQALWLEFIEALFKTMAGRTHKWMVDRIQEIQDALQEEHAAAVSNTSLSTTELASLNKAFLEKSADFNKILSQADYTVFMSLKGFHGYSNTSQDHLATILHRHSLFYDCVDNMTWPATKSLLENKDDLNLGFANRKATMDVHKESIDQRAQARSLVRPPAVPLGEEHWITFLRSRIRWSLSHGGPRDQTWGFVAYRMTYKNSKSEWAQFQEKISHDRKESKDWITGSDNIFGSAGLIWLDGQELGLPEGDYGAAMRHFDNFRKTPQMLPRMQKQQFIIIDEASYQSYMTHNPETDAAQPLGDFVGFVSLVDTMFKPNENTYPDYAGVLRVAGGLLWNHMYPMAQSLSTSPENMFALAYTHPWGVYTGVTQQLQERQRITICAMRDAAIEETMKKMNGSANA